MSTPSLTEQAAADPLNVSRPYLVKLLEHRDLPYTLVSNQRRVNSDNLLGYAKV